MDNERLNYFLESEGELGLLDSELLLNTSLICIDYSNLQINTNKYGAHIDAHSSFTKISETGKIIFEVFKNIKRK